jgi:DNA-binding NarL/FixJ family response regulator
VSSSSPIRVLLCDESSSSLARLREALAVWPEVRCVGTTASSEKIQKLVEAEQVNVVLIRVLEQHHNVFGWCSTQKKIMPSPLP